jgi:hypothetical protein
LGIGVDPSDGVPSFGVKEISVKAIEDVEVVAKGEDLVSVEPSTDARPEGVLQA